MRSFLSMPKHFSKYDFCISKLFLASSIVKNDRMKWFVIEFSEILCYILWFFTREFQDGDYSLRFVIWQFFILQSWSGVCRVFEFFIDSREKIIPFSSQFIPLFFWLDFRDFSQFCPGWKKIRLCENQNHDEPRNLWLDFLNKNA